MTVLSLPFRQGIAAAVSFWPWANTITSTSPLTRDQQTVALPGVLWRAQITMPPLAEPAWRDWAAFLASLSGAAGRFNVVPPHAHMPQGQDAPQTWGFDDDTEFTDGSGFYDPPNEITVRGDVVSTKILLRTEGWDLSAAVLKAGDFVSWSNKERRFLAILAQDANSDGSGNADLKLAFPAPEIPASGRRVYPWWPSVTMRLMDDDQAAQAFKEGRFAEVAFEAVEASPY